MVAGVAAAELWASFRPSRFEVKVVRVVVPRIPFPPDQALQSVSKCLQALGILCCVAAGRDLVACRCLQDLGKRLLLADLDNELKELAKSELWPESTP